MHDEFSYLLAADTFAHGRLANPVHPMGVFFESPHILISPHYMSMYQPGLGALLAIGQILFGHPYYGVMLGCMLLCASLAQMLLAWTNRKWALIGGACACLIFQPGMDWATSYMGGEIAAIAAAISLTALGHVARHRAPWGLPHFALAASLLLMSRPFEGSFFLLAVLASAFWLGWGRMPLAPILRANLPIIAITVAFQLYFNFRGTGSPWVVPFLLHDQLYNSFRIFWFLPLHPLHEYSHPRLYAQHGPNGFEVGMWRSWEGLPAISLVYRLIKNVFKSGLESWLSVPLGIVLLGVGIPAAFWSRKSRILIFVALGAVFPLFLIAFHTPQYASLLIVTLFLIAILGLRRLFLFHVGAFAAGKPAAILLVGALCINSAVAISNFHETLSDPLAPPTRSALIEKLQSQPGNHLIIVRYPMFETWNVFTEWVYNTADPDSSRIVFAHDLGPTRQPALIQYYKDRHMWLLEFATDGFYTLSPL